ncbi:MAG: hypothetical protein HYV16_15000 [Gammaproteobacteria bacterium]|nr:hypothetical protein [Gammaproteobacteria bacterium]
MYSHTAPRRIATRPALPALGLALLLALGSGLAWAQGEAGLDAGSNAPMNEVLLLDGPESSPAAETAEQSFENEYRSVPGLPPLVHADLDLLPAERRLARLNRARLAVSFGLRPAAEALRLRPDLPLVLLLARKLELDRLRAGQDARITGIYLEQPYRRALAAAQALGADGSVGILLGAESAPWLSESLEDAARQVGMPLRLRRMRPLDSPLRQFEALLKTCTAIVAQPDPAVFSSQNLQALMLNAYRHRVPVIGFSEAMVQAGALAAVYNDPVLLGRQAAQLVRRSLSETPMPPPEYPTQYGLTLNYQVARNLGLAQLSEDALRRAILRHEPGQSQGKPTP